jgi:hypothetical protein
MLAPPPATAAATAAALLFAGPFAAGRVVAWDLLDAAADFSSGFKGLGPIRLGCALQAAGALPPRTGFAAPRGLGGVHGRLRRIGAASALAAGALAAFRWPGLGRLPGL